MSKDGSDGYLSCIMCDADVPVSKEDVGSEIYCSFCQITLRLRQSKDEEEFYFEEED